VKPEFLPATWAFIVGVGVGEAKGPNEMETHSNVKKTLTDEAYHVSAADLADKIIVLMQRGSNPLFLSTSTWALVRASQYQGINREEALINPVGG
jgi:hypothetical protein